jgi:hypothetical protein
MADISLEKSLPNNLEAERSILGAILLDDKAVLTVFETIRSQDFYLESHRRVFEKMLQLMNSSRPIDTVTLKEELQRANELESVGGAAYLASLTDGLPRAMNIEHYARIVKQKSTLLPGRGIRRRSPAARRKGYIRYSRPAVPYGLFAHFTHRQRRLQADRGIIQS